MKVQIEEIVEDKSGVWARVSTELGSCWAFWNDGRPKIGGTYHVEVEVDRLLRVRESVLPTATTHYLLACERRDAPVELIGQVVGQREGGVVEVRLAQDLVDIEVQGDLMVGDWIEARIFPLKFYDEGL